MRLYLVRGCPFGHRASFVLKEKGLAFEHVFFERQRRPPELDAVSPHAKSPTLFDDPEVVWESAIVLEYLEDRHPEPPLLPRDAAGRARARMLAALVGLELGPTQGRLVSELVLKPEHQRDQAVVATATRELAEALARWDERLAGKSYLLGDFGLADVTLYTPLVSLRKPVGFEIPASLENLRGWFERMAQRPAAAPLA